MPSNMFATGQSLFSVQPDKAFATNRTIYFTYAVLPAGADPAKQRSPAHVHVASARISADDKRLEDVKDLLDAEGTGGRVIQANDGTLLVETTVPAGLGINSAEWMQPQQPDSLMGKVLRINADGIDSQGQPVRRQGRRAAGDLRARLPRPAGHGHPSEDRAGSGRASTARAAATRSTRSRRARTTASRSSATGATTTASRSTATRPSQAGMEQPVYFWTPDIAPAGIAFYTGKMFPAWNGNLFVSALAGRYLVRLVLDGTTASSPRSGC